MRRLMLLIALFAVVAVAVGCVTSQSPEDRAVSEAKRDLAQHLGVSVESIALGSVEKVEWPGPDLGLPAKPGPTPEVSLPVIVPGWRITLIVEGEEYEYRVGELEKGELKVVRLGSAGSQLAPERERDKPSPGGEASIPEQPTWPPQPKVTPTGEATID